MSKLIGKQHGDRQWMSQSMKLKWDQCISVLFPELRNSTEGEGMDEELRAM